MTQLGAIRGMYGSWENVFHTPNGSNPARTHDVWMAHRRRAEIFALPSPAHIRRFALFRRVPPLVNVALEELISRGRAPT
ncbi:MAG TPA: hypothetical protein VGH55_05115, partial [Chthoniobacterales bacterium]